MKIQSLDEFLEEMAKKPQTLGWDVIGAFDRNKTNYLLLQDYISRFSAASLFPPVDSSVSTGSSATHQLRGMQLDKPRLSFDNAVITQSRARCLMRTVGGHIFEDTRPQGTTRSEIKRLGIADGLVGPILTMTIHLRNTPGSVTSAGRVELDLAGNGATDFKLSGVDTNYEVVKLGEHLEKEIKGWTSAQKTFELGELRKNADDPLQPGEFRVLTRPAPGATARKADNFGDGEVLLLIGLNDRSGTLPSNDTQIPYLLPQGYSSNLVISFEQIVTRMMISALKDTRELRSLELEGVSVGKFKRYVAKGGAFDAQITVPGWDGWRFEYYDSLLPFTSATKLTLELSNGASVLKWAGSTEFNGAAITRVINPPNPPADVRYNGRVRVHWDVECHFKPRLGKDEHGRTIILVEGDVKKADSRSEFVSGSGDKAGAGYFKAASEGVGESIALRLESLRSTFEALGFSIDAFRLNGLLFRDESVVVPRDIAMPGDLTALGDLGAQATEYKLSHSEVAVTAEGSHSFTVTPSISNLRWSVSPLPGEPVGEEFVGKISAAGVYTAPAAASFGFTFKRVIVTATNGSWTGKALVHLVAAPVSVFPKVNTVNLTDDDSEGYLVWAASTNGGALDWQISGNAGGWLENEDAPDVQAARRYFAPEEFPAGGTSGLEKVLRVDKIEVSQAGGQTTTCEMLLTKSPKQDYFFKYESIAGGVQLEFWVTNDDGESEKLPPEDTEWHKVSGHGELDATGKYTFSPSAVDHYLIVAAIDLLGGTRNLMWNYKILPIPLIEASGIAAKQPGVK